MLSDDCVELTTYSFTDVDQLRQRFRERPNPLTRYVLGHQHIYSPHRQERLESSCRHYSRYISAENSRSPLNCSVGMLKCTLTNDQVPPAFLRAVYAFGDQEEGPMTAGWPALGAIQRSLKATLTRRIPCKMGTKARTACGISSGRSSAVESR
jgi:hypothetical protein